jgi:hypothetical protein
VEQRVRINQPRLSARELEEGVPAARPLRADAVEKVENRTAPKISRKLILSRLDRRNPPWRRSKIGAQSGTGAAHLEAEMLRRGMIFDVIDWSEDIFSAERSATQ